MKVNFKKMALSKILSKFTLQLLYWLFIILFIPIFVYSQKPSQLVFSIETSLKKGNHLLGTKRSNDTCFLIKNKKINDLEKEDTLFCKVYKGKKLAYKNELRHQLNGDFDYEKDKIDAIFKLDFELISENLAAAKKEKKTIFEGDFERKASFQFKNSIFQVIDYQLDSFSVEQKITLNLPKCIDKKQGGIVTVYYRATREHLNKNQLSESSAKVFDWGHAFIGIKDLKTNKLYFLDGWPDGNWGEGGQRFIWNENVDAVRTSDHHSITFNISPKHTKSVIEQIEQIKHKTVDYKMVDFNCTDATTTILAKIGYYTTKDHAHTVFPDSFANQLMEKLNQIKVCFEYDGFKIR